MKGQYASSVQKFLLDSLALHPPESFSIPLLNADGPPQGFLASHVYKGLRIAVYMQSFSSYIIFRYKLIILNKDSKREFFIVSRSHRGPGAKFDLWAFVQLRPKVLKISG